jgi:hypothetical protein
MEEIKTRVSKLVNINNLIILDKELVLNSNESVNIVFGPLSSYYVKWHDIIITPSSPESFLTIKITLDGFSTEFTTNEPIDIIQKPCEPYPSFELQLKSVLVSKKKYFYEGVVSVSGGACKINKFDQMLVDH